MRYLLTLYGEEERPDDMPPDEMRAALAAWGEFDRQATEAGVLVACEALQLAETASTMRVPGSEDRPVTDGPFAETKEQLGGFVLIDCASREEALEWARKVPLREGSSIEVRETMDWRAFAAAQEEATEVTTR